MKHVAFLSLKDKDFWFPGATWRAQDFSSWSWTSWNHKSAYTEACVPKIFGLATFDKVNQVKVGNKKVLDSKKGVTIEVSHGVF